MNKYVLQLFAVIFFPIIVGATQQDERITAEKIRMNFSNPVIDETGKKYEIECVKAALDNGENGIGAIYPDLYELAISIVRENLNNPRLYTGVWGDYKCHKFDYLFLAKNCPDLREELATIVEEMLTCKVPGMHEAEYFELALDRNLGGIGAVYPDLYRLGIDSFRNLLRVNGANCNIEHIKVAKN